MELELQAEQREEGVERAGALLEGALDEVCAVGGGCGRGRRGGGREAVLVGREGDEEGKGEEPDADGEEGRDFGEGWVVGRDEVGTQTVVDGGDGRVGEVAEPDDVVGEGEGAHEEKQRAGERQRVLWEGRQGAVVDGVGEEGEECGREREAVHEPEPHEQGGYGLEQAAEHAGGGGQVVFHDLGHVVEAGGDGERGGDEAEHAADDGKELEEHCVGVGGRGDSTVGAGAVGATDTTTVKHHQTLFAKPLLASGAWPVLPRSHPRRYKNPTRSLELSRNCHTLLLSFSTHILDYISR